MTQPLLQLALDELQLDSAIAIVHQLAAEVDIIEAGTLLVCSEGMRAVRTLRELCPSHTLVSDIKGADAGGMLADMCFAAGANWMTIICCAPIATVQSAQKSAQTFANNNEIQIELFGEWTWQQAEDWLKCGVKQAIYHRGRDAQAAGQSWSDHDLSTIARLANMGFGVSVTGGITANDLAFFSGIPVKAFIAGRALSAAPNPVEAARAFKRQLHALWP